MSQSGGESKNDGRKLSAVTSQVEQIQVRTTLEILNRLPNIDTYEFIHIPVDLASIALSLGRKKKRVFCKSLHRTFA